MNSSKPTASLSAPRSRRLVLSAFTLIIAFAGTPLRAVAAATPDAAIILQKAVQNVFSRSEQSTYVMKLVDADGHETDRKMKVFYRRDGDDSAKLVVKFTAPADIRGTALLSVMEKGKAADQWIYLPKLRKTRRIWGGNESESFLGSDFTVGDLTRTDKDQDRYVSKLTHADKKCGNQICYEITETPKPGVDPSSLPYAKRVLDIRKKGFVTARVDFFDASGALMKTLQLKGIHQDGGKYWSANAMEMQDVRSHHRTVIAVKSRDTGKTPSNSIFTRSYLERD